MLQPVTEGWRISDFAELGPGTTAYLKFEKYLATLYLVLFVVLLPNLVIDVSGGAKGGATAPSPLFITTIGNVAAVREGGGGNRGGGKRGGGLRGGGGLTTSRHTRTQTLGI